MQVFTPIIFFSCRLTSYLTPSIVLLWYFLKTIFRMSYHTVKSFSFSQNRFVKTTPQAWWRFYCTFLKIWLQHVHTWWSDHILVEDCPSDVGGLKLAVSQVADGFFQRCLAPAAPHSPAFWSPFQTLSHMATDGSSDVHNHSHRTSAPHHQPASHPLYAEPIHSLACASVPWLQRHCK